MGPEKVQHVGLHVRAAGDDLHLEGDRKAVADLIRFLEDGPEFHFHPPTPVDVACSVSRESYMENAGQLLNAIARGDIYEVNYCVPFFGNAPDFDPQSRFHTLQSLTEAPFSVFARMADRHILCASPERFLKNKGGRLTSQPIKGTIRRSPDADEDNHLRDQLFNDEKERAENVMIVDLVRNDLSRVAARSSVRVRELFGVYTFKTVHHLVSTIEADLDEKSRPLDAIRAGFPPGSMTGAPKISAMERIEKHENFKRGCYAGSFGKLEANGDFDLNVVIRTIIHHPGKETVGFAVGGALTAGTHPDREYRECLLKAEALIKVLHGTDGH